ncbi:MAG: ferrous iron transport protein B [Oscillospiraceae bacterium]|nr:ferrous iron transport protein B [Oscillospiraceae bacterium]
MAVKIALAGNPNSGKTTLFNALTGSNQSVGNWPGVTVEKKEGKLKGHRNVTVIDLPGIYSLSPYTLEEIVSRNFLIDEYPDAILNIIDGTNLERNLFLTTQLAELGIPIVLAVNMIDLVQKSGDEIDASRLSGEIGCPVVAISARKGLGISEAAEAAVNAARGTKALPRHSFSESVEHTLAHIERTALHNLPQKQRRFFAIKLLEGDSKIIEKLELSSGQISRIEEAVNDLEAKLEDDGESIVTAERYAYIESIIKDCVKIKNRGKISLSDKIDRVVTNRWLALPIFAAVMFAVYFISVTAAGNLAAVWVEGVWIPEAILMLDGALESANCAGWLQGLITDGIAAGVGSVLSFVPQLLVLFFFLAFLEACGYMARIAFIMDRIFRRFGLSGKSFIPILIGTGCAVPGIMASRTIECSCDRKMTVITTPFIPCAAKLPVIAVIAGALFGGAAWVAPSAYFTGMAAIVCSGLILKKTRLFAGDASPFVMELPAYRLPLPGIVLRSMWERTWSFIKKAGTVILLASALIWLAASFGWNGGGFGMSDMNNSLLAGIGRFAAPLFAPLGWGDWQSAVAAFTGLIAKENIVGTFGILFGFAGADEGGNKSWGILASHFTALGGYSFLIFNLLCVPCVAAVGAIRREMNSAKWFWFAIGYQCAFAYAASLCVYQLGMLFSGNFGAGTVAAVILLGLFLRLLTKKPDSRDKIALDKAPGRL